MKTKQYLSILAVVIGFLCFSTSCDVLVDSSHDESYGELTNEEEEETNNSTTTNTNSGNEEEEETTTENPSDNTPPTSNTRLKVMTWNLYNFGKSKDDSEMDFIAKTMRGYDVVAIQEVSTGPAGAQAVARLVDKLDRMGANWDYKVSDPTDGPGTERYAYVWKSSRVSLSGRAWLSGPLKDKVDREPYLARFKTKKGQTLLIASFHAIPKAKKPATEIVHLESLDKSYSKDNLMVMGDFNYGADKPAFEKLINRGYDPVVNDQKTSLKMKEKNGEHLAEPYDNIFYEKDAFKVRRAGVIDFSSQFSTLKEARTISDHIPVWVEVEWL